jgi:acetyl-CoA C-acetyltransferase
MNQRVAIIGVGFTPFRSVTPDLSYREMIYEAAVKGYADAGVEHSEIQSFVSCTEDFTEGTSISDEYCPDQIGAATKPVHTIAGDGIHGLASAFMLIRSGLFDLMTVESHSKVSNVDNMEAVHAYAMDPVYQRAIGLSPQAIAGLEMRRFLHESGNKELHVASVTAKNRRNALSNPLASNPGRVTPQEVLQSDEVSSPLRKGEIAPDADGAIVMVLASERKSRKVKKPVWIHGIGWASDTYSLESRQWGCARYATDAARLAYRSAGIKNPRASIDLAEIDDTYAYKELQHLEAIGLVGKGQAGRLVTRLMEKGPNGLAVNISGGALGGGNLHEANGLARVLEVVLQIRGEAGKRQLDKVKTGLALSWRGVPTATGAVAVLGVKKP